MSGDVQCTKGSGSVRGAFCLRKMLEDSKVTMTYVLLLYFYFYSASTTISETNAAIFNSKTCYNVIINILKRCPHF